MNRRFMSLMAGCVLVSGFALAAEFWERKEFTEWTDKEIRKILTDSPWARTVELALAMPSAGEGGGRMRMPGGGGGGMGGGDLEEGGGMPRMGGEGVAAGPMPTVSVQLRWVSALPVKQAIARVRFGEEAATSPEARQMLERQETHYILAVAGVPARWIGQDFDALKERAELRVKGHEPLHPAQVQGQRRERAAELYLAFPRGANGGFDITPEDKEIEVVIKLAERTIRSKFKLSQMMYKGKLEI